MSQWSGIGSVRSKFLTVFLFKTAVSDLQQPVLSVWGQIKISLKLMKNQIVHLKNTDTVNFENFFLN